jgi:hypothetical protein
MTRVERTPTFSAMVRRLPLLLLALVALAPFAVGCGGGQGSGGDVALPVLEDFEPVANATSNADSAKFEMTFAMEMQGVPGFDVPFEFSAAGAFDTPARKAQLTMDLGSFAELLGGLAGAFGGGNAPDELTDPSKWKLEMRLDGTVAYMRLPFMAGELPAGKEWVQVDLGKAAELQGVDLADIQSFAKGSDPRETLDYLRSVSGELTNMGTEDVRGVPTVHYFASVDWKKALARAASESGQQGILAQFQNMPNAVASLPVDVWVDAGNLVRRMTLGFSFAAPGQPGETKGSIEMELFDYGQPVEVEAPDAKDVVDALSLKR